MGIQSLQKFIESNCQGACVPVDLLKIARVGRRDHRVFHHHKAGSGSAKLGYPTASKLCLVVDGECCLDRLYGGFFSDWVCGGQWNRMVQFLAVLIQTVQHSNIELAVFFNGSLESQRIGEWVRTQHNERKKINQVLKHVNTKGTPPPKVWWVPPVCLTTCLRMALRHLNISVVCTMDDHHQEVIAYCRENDFHGLMAEDAEYAIFDPPRYFSSEQLKLTYKGSLETKEFILDEVAKGLDLHPNRFCVFAALLGNYLLTEEDLLDFYKTICPEAKTKQVIPSDSLINAVCKYVRELPSIDNLDVIGCQVFVSTGTSPQASRLAEERTQKFKQCVQYYLNGTKDGFLRYRPSTNARKFESGHYPPTNRSSMNNNSQNHQHQQTRPVQAPLHHTPASQQQPSSTSPLASSAPPSADLSKFASETVESELSSLTAYKEATAYAAQLPTPQIVIEPPIAQQNRNNLDGVVLAPDANSTSPTKAFPGSLGDSYEEGSEVSDTQVPAVAGPGNGDVSSRGAGCYPIDQWSMNGNTQHQGQPGNGIHKAFGNQSFQLPSIPPEVLRTASERHQKGLMSPWIYQILSQGEMKIPVSIEEEVPKDLPSCALLFRPVRQMVYAILFNLHHIHFLAKQRSEEENSPDITVREWVWTKNNPYRSPDLVKAQPLGWAVPTVQRLWFGSTLDDKKRRLRAFLTCMHSDTSLMLNTTYIPQHLLVMCCVLRYIISNNDRRILRKQELDAFLSQAVSPQLMDAQFMQAMQLPLITTRGVQLAALFLRGVEAALFANDACGAPVPWLMCCPWLFFDGKLFHHKLLKANTAKNLIEICDGQIDQVAKVERMRQAILEGLKVEFARPPLPMMAPQRLPSYPPPPSHTMIPAGAPPNTYPPIRGRGRAVMGAMDPARAGAMPGRRSMMARGGQLEIAGVVVGSWGPNCGASGTRGRGVHVAPQVTSVGGVRSRYGAVPAVGVARGAGYMTYSRGKRVTRGGKIVPPSVPSKRKPKKTVRGPAKLNAGDDGSNDKVLKPLGRGCTVEPGDSKPVLPIAPAAAKVGESGDTVDNVLAEKLVARTDDATVVPTLNGQFEDAKEAQQLAAGIVGAADDLTVKTEALTKTVIMKKITAAGDHPAPAAANDTADIHVEIASVAAVSE